MVDAREPEDLPQDASADLPPDFFDEECPLVGADFVPDTLDKVIEDRLRIAAEAARVDEIRIDREVLACYAVPEPSAGFVERTLRRVVAQRGAGLPSAPDEELHDLLGAMQPPAPRDEFVERTLRAVMAIHPAAKRQTRRRLPRRIAAFAVAAAVLAALAFGFFAGSPPRIEPGPYHDTPVAFARLLHESSAAGSRLALVIRAPDDFTDFVAALEGGRR